MAPITHDDLRRRSGADVDTGTRGRVQGFANAHQDRPIRHLVIFHTPVVGAVPIRPAGG